MEYSPWHKCIEHNFFQIDACAFEDIPTDEAPIPYEAQPSDHVEAPIVTPMEPEEPIISLHSLSGISAPHTMKLKGYIKHRWVVVLIDSGSTHNFLHCRLSVEIHFFFALFLIFKSSSLMVVL
jgi:hypothetical protein